MTTRKYIPYIDAIKGFAIFLVVMGHVLAWQFDNFTDIVQQKESPQTMFLWRMIYSFHMPLFFFISGYLFSKSKFAEIDGPKYIWKKATTLIVPFITMGTLFYLVRDKLYNYWFLRSLFEFILIALPFEIYRSRTTKMQSTAFSILYYGGVYFVLIMLHGYLQRISWLYELIDIRYNYFMFFSLGLILRRIRQVLGRTIASGGGQMLSVISEQFVFALLISILIILLCLSLASIINKSRILSVFLLGRPSKM